MTKSKLGGVQITSTRLNLNYQTKNKLFNLHHMSYCTNNKACDHLNETTVGIFAWKKLVFQ
jgi:hypothetical protein